MVDIESFDEVMAGHDDDVGALAPILAGRALTPQRLQRLRGPLKRVVRRARIVQRAACKLPDAVRANLVNRRGVHITPRGVQVLRVRLNRTADNDTVGEIMNAMSGGANHVIFGDKGRGAAGSTKGYDGTLTPREAGFLLEDGVLPQGWRHRIDEIGCLVDTLDGSDVVLADLMAIGDLDLRYSEGGETAGIRLTSVRHMPARNHVALVSGSDATKAVRFQGPAYKTGGTIVMSEKDDKRRFRLVTHKPTATLSKPYELSFVLIGRLEQTATVA